MGNRNITPGKRAAVLDRDGHKCTYCGSTYNLDVDHIIPVAKGGTSNIENLHTLCSICNSSKGMKVSPHRISREELEEYKTMYFSKVLKVLSRMKGDKFVMTRDELAKALEEYPQKLREALLRRHKATLRLDEAIAEARVSRIIPKDDNFDRARAKLQMKIRQNPTEYGLTPSRLSNDAIEQALLASDEYEELKREREKLLGDAPDPIDIGAANILKAREEKGLADIEVEVLHKTLETYHLLAAIMK